MHAGILVDRPNLSSQPACARGIRWRLRRWMAALEFLCLPCQQPMGCGTLWCVLELKISITHEIPCPLNIVYCDTAKIRRSILQSIISADPVCENKWGALAPEFLLCYALGGAPVLVAPLSVCFFTQPRTKHPVRRLPTSGCTHGAPLLTGVFFHTAWHKTPSQKTSDQWFCAARGWRQT